MLVVNRFKVSDETAFTPRAAAGGDRRPARLRAGSSAAVDEPDPVPGDAGESVGA